MQLAAGALALAAALGVEQLLDDPIAARGAVQDALDLFAERLEGGGELDEEAIGLLELAAPEVHVAPQERGLVDERRARKARLQLIEQIDRGVVIAALVHRPRGLEERLGHPLGVVGDLEVVVERVVRALALVGHAAQREPRQIADLEVARIHVEGEALGVLRGRDRAEERLGAREVAVAGRDDAAEVLRVRVEAAAATDRQERGVGAREIVRVVASAPPQVAQLVQRIGGKARLADELERAEHPVQVRALERDVDAAPVRRTEVGILRAARQDAVQVAERGAVRAELLQRAGEQELGVAVAVRAREVGVAGRLDELEEHERGGVPLLVGRELFTAQQLRLELGVGAGRRIHRTALAELEQRRGVGLLGARMRRRASEHRAAERDDAAEPRAHRELSHRPHATTRAPGWRLGRGCGSRSDPRRPRGTSARCRSRPRGRS